MRIIGEIDEVSWGDFETAYGSATEVADWLKDLCSDDLAQAKNASHQLWCSLCHQHAYVSTAARPSLPILLKILEIVHDEVKVEVLDILLGFERCSSPKRPDFGKDAWVGELRNRFEESLENIRPFLASENQLIRGFSEGILEGFNQF